ncbi:MAG: protein adenylyltransferase SelO family protein, partial [Bacteroidota bacterium]
HGRISCAGCSDNPSMMVLETPNKVWREMDQRGGMLLRTAPHHVRIGTLEYAIRALSPEDYARYAMAILNRSMELWNGANVLEQGCSLYGVGGLDPEAVRCYFEEWSRRQAELLAHWMRVGFAHGVLNTDNISLMGMTLDLGPCAFVNTYDLKRSFSSIDQYRRYAWGRQSEIMEWNAGVLLSCLLPLLDGDRNEGRALLIAQDLLLQYRSGVEQALKRMQWMKLGLDPQRYSNHEEARSLVSDWQAWLEESRPDYGLAYLNLEEVLQQAMQQDSEPLTNHGQVKESTRRQASVDLPPMDWVARWIHFLEGVGDGACLSS